MSGFTFIQGSSIKNILQLLLMIAFFGTGLATLLSLFGAYQQLFELLTHFRVQYFALLLISGTILSIMGSKRWLIPALLLIMPNLLGIVPYYQPLAEVRKPGPSFKLMNANVLISNKSYERFNRVVQAYNPDIVALEEINEAWAEGVKPVFKKYPYQKVIPLDNAFGIGLYSRIPLTDVQVKYYGDAYGTQYFPSILAKAEWQGQQFTILVTHPLPPMGGFAVRNSQLEHIAKERAQFGEHALITGDLNVSPWSPYFVRLLQKSGLRDSQKGFGVQPSWPADTPWCRTPIDHVLVSPGFIVINRQLGPNIGSDHLPVMVELALPRKT